MCLELGLVDRSEKQNNIEILKQVRQAKLDKFHEDEIMEQQTDLTARI